MKNIKVYIGNNVYNDWSPECEEYDREKQLHHVGDVHHVCREETARNQTRYTFAIIGKNSEGQWENGQCFYNEGDHRIVKISGEYAICEPVSDE